MKTPNRPDLQTEVEPSAPVTATTKAREAKPAWTEPTVEDVSVLATEGGFAGAGADNGFYS